MWISKERSRVLARRLLHTNDTPERTSLAFAVGFGIAFSPFIGFHTVIALALAFALKLNRLAVIWGTFANNPYTLVPIVTFATLVGSWMTGSAPPQLPLPVLQDLLSFQALWLYFEDLWWALKPGWLPFFIGSLTLSIVAGTVSYFLALPIIRQVRERHGLGPLAHAVAHGKSVHSVGQGKTAQSSGQMKPLPSTEPRAAGSNRH